jgi:hypothetical protein
VVAAILAGLEQDRPAELASWRNPRGELQRLVKRDYVRPLRQNLGYHELVAITRLACRVWPRFNEDQLTSAPAEQFREMAARTTAALRVHLQTHPYTGPDGLALRGFYVEAGRAMNKRPLIYVNTAHHPVAVSTTFCHELGHHLTETVFQEVREPVHFYFDADYSSHLDDPVELAADAICSLAGYPQSLAREIFSTPWNWGLVAKTGKLPADVLERVFKHVQRRFGMDFDARIPGGQRLNYLAGMIHYAKLRWALLAEYDL